VQPVLAEIFSSFFNTFKILFSFFLLEIANEGLKVEKMKLIKAEGEVEEKSGGETRSRNISSLISIPISIPE